MMGVKTDAVSTRQVGEMIVAQGLAVLHGTCHLFDLGLNFCCDGLRRPV